MALVVAAKHLTGWGEGIAGYALHAFYAVSGYLMTIALTRSYGFTVRGFGRFAANRVLRIYPPFWVASAVTLVIVAVAPGLALEFHRNFQLPADWISALTNWYWKPDDEAHLVPPSWALAVEMVLYAGLGLGLSRSLGGGASLACLGAAYHVWALYHGLDRYHPIPAAALPYGLGVMAYWLSIQTSERVFSALCAVFAVFLVGQTWVPGDIWGWKFYAVIGAIFLLLCTRPSRGASTWDRIDRMIGEMSYPIYLLQYQAAFIVFAFGAPVRGWTLFGATLPCLLASSALLAWLSLHLIEPGRTRIRLRESHQHTPNSQSAAAR